MSSFTEPVEGPPRGEWRKGVTLLAVLVGYQILLHWAVSSDPGGLGGLLAILPLAAALVWFLGRSWRGRLGLTALALAAGCGLVAWQGASANPAWVYLLPQLGVYLFLLWLFGRTLMPGREALVTRLARSVHGTLPKEIERYSRHVTMAWCLFFAGMALTSLLLFVLAPLAAWSVFANLLNVPLVVAMFLAEYLYRILRYPNFSHASIRSSLQAFHKLGGSGRAPGH
jgi:uncharacterized membrane protein